MDMKTVLTMLSLAAPIAQGVEVIAAEKDSATKKQMAQDSLLLASGVASSIDPKDTVLIGAATQAAGLIIEGVVAAFNHAGIFKHAKPTPKPAPAPVVAVPVAPVPVPAPVEHVAVADPAPAELALSAPPQSIAAPHIVTYGA